MARLSVPEQNHDARMSGIEHTNQFRDAPTDYLCGEIRRVAEELASEEHHRSYRLGLIAGYVAILAGREEHVALIETMRTPEVFHSIREAKRRAGDDD